MSKNSLPALRKRIIEVYLSEIILSAIFALSTKFAIISSGVSLLFIANILYFGWSAYCLFKYRIEIPKKRNYYLTNLLSVCSLCLIAVIFALVLKLFESSAFFSALCMVFDCLFFMFRTVNQIAVAKNYEISIIVSTLIYSALQIIIVLLLPLLINKKRYYVYLSKRG